jgi:4-hydroxybenzoyl-CoA reductase beta subunit
MSKVLKPFEYFEARSIGEAIEMLSTHGTKAKVIAGGTDLLVTMKRGVVDPDYLINIKTIPNLDGIEYDEKSGFIIGALTTLHGIETSSLINKNIDVLAQAAHQVAAPRIRSVGTIGGNLCQDTKCEYYARTYLWRRTACYRGEGDVCYAVKGAKRCPAMAIAETAPALICLEAKACISGPTGERLLAVEDFFVSSGVVDLKEDEILTAIKIPKLPSHTGGAYLRYSLRGAPDFAIAGAAVVLTASDGVCEDARIGLLGVDRTPLRAHRAEELLRGKRMGDDLIDEAAQTAAKATHPLGDVFSTARYRRKIVDVLVKRAARQALDAAKKA